MLKLHSYDDKTYEGVIEKAIKDLNVSKEDLYIKQQEVEEGKIFKTKKVKIEVISKEEIKEFIKEFISNIERGMSITIQSEIREIDGIFQILLVSEENGILIGKDGRTLNSLQQLLRQAINVATNFNIKISIDAGNYRAKKMRNFEFDIKKIMREVETSKVDASLDPMNSYERRIIHNLANKFDNISTSSDGEGKDRHVVIHYNH